MLAPARALPRRLPRQPDAELLRRAARRPRRLRDQPRAGRRGRGADAGPRRAAGRCETEALDVEARSTRLLGLVSARKERWLQSTVRTQRRAARCRCSQTTSARGSATAGEWRRPSACGRCAPARRDALPEHTHYADTGCDLHPSCLTCPLVRCRYDEPGGARKLLSDERDRDDPARCSGEGGRSADRRALRRFAAHRVSRAGALESRARHRR